VFGGNQAPTNHCGHCRHCMHCGHCWHCSHRSRRSHRIVCERHVVRLRYIFSARAQQHQGGGVRFYTVDKARGSYLVWDLFSFFLVRYFTCEKARVDGQEGACGQEAALMPQLPLTTPGTSTPAGAMTTTFSRFSFTGGDWV